MQTGFCKYRLKMIETPEGKQPITVVEPPFTLPNKIYGDTLERCGRVLERYPTQEGNLGVLLTGLSGAGKTLLAKLLAVKFNELYKIPTVIVDETTAKDIGIFLQQVNHPCLFIFDEFEKMFEYPTDQDYLLTILDGMYTGKHIFVLTANNTNKISPYLYNRPSRIRYYWDYTRIPADVIEEILKDRLVDKSKKTKVMDLMLQIFSLSFDTLNSFIDEVNLFKDKEPDELIKGFNGGYMDYRLDTAFDVDAYVDGNSVSQFFKSNEDTSTYSLNIMRNVKFKDITDNRAKTIVYIGEYDANSSSPNIIKTLSFKSVANIEMNYDDIRFDAEINFNGMETDNSSPFGPRRSGVSKETMDVLMDKLKGKKVSFVLTRKDTSNTFGKDTTNARYNYWA